VNADDSTVTPGGEVHRQRFKDRLAPEEGVGAENRVINDLTVIFDEHVAELIRDAHDISDLRAAGFSATADLIRLRRRPNGRQLPSGEGRPVGRARGRKGGRKPLLSPEKIQRARQLYDEKGDDGERLYTVAAIGEHFGVSRQTIYRCLEPEQPGPSTNPRQEAS